MLPPRLRVALSSLVGVTILAFGSLVFGGGYLLPFLAAWILAFSVASSFRVVSTARRLPEPYGAHASSTVRTADAARHGAFLVLLGVSLVILPYLALVYLSSVLVLVAILGVVGGYPLSDLLFYTWVRWIEARSGRDLFFVIESCEKDEGDRALVRSIEFGAREESL